VTFSVYPKGLGQEVIKALVKDREGELQTPRVVIGPFRSKETGSRAATCGRVKAL
jgi:hypothetical protein